LGFLTTQKIFDLRDGPKQAGLIGSLLSNDIDHVCRLVVGVPWVIVCPVGLVAVFAVLILLLGWATLPVLGVWVCALLAVIKAGGQIGWNDVKLNRLKDKRMGKLATDLK
jgi:hypothetical protein